MNNDSDKTARFVSLFAAYNRRIYALVRAMVHNRADADDVFQEILLCLWAKFDQFQPGTSFWSWACAMTRLEALRFLRQHRVHARLFSDAFYEAIEQRAVQMEAVLDSQQDALADCYAKLTGRPTEVVRSNVSARSYHQERGCKPRAIHHRYLQGFKAGSQGAV